MVFKVTSSTGVGGSQKLTETVIAPQPVMMGPAVQISEEDAERQAEAILRFVPLPLPLPYMAHVSFAPSPPLPSSTVGAVPQHNGRHNLADAATMTEQIGSPPDGRGHRVTLDNTGLLDGRSSATTESVHNLRDNMAGSHSQQIPLSGNSAPNHGLMDQHVLDLMQGSDEDLRRTLFEIENIDGDGDDLAAAVDDATLNTNAQDGHPVDVHVLDVLQHQNVHSMNVHETWSESPRSPISFSLSDEDLESDTDAELFAPSLQETATPVDFYPQTTRRTTSRTASSASRVRGPESADTLYISDDSTAGSSSSDECEIIMVEPGHSQFSSRDSRESSREADGVESSSPQIAAEVPAHIPSANSGAVEEHEQASSAMASSSDGTAPMTAAVVPELPVSPSGPSSSSATSNTANNASLLATISIRKKSTRQAILARRVRSQPFLFRPRRPFHDVVDLTGDSDEEVPAVSFAAPGTSHESIQSQLSRDRINSSPVPKLVRTRVRLPEPINGASSETVSAAGSNGCPCTLPRFHPGPSYAMTTRGEATGGPCGSGRRSRQVLQRSTRPLGPSAPRGRIVHHRSQDGHGCTTGSSPTCIPPIEQSLPSSGATPSSAPPPSSGSLHAHFPPLSVGPYVTLASHPPPMIGPLPPVTPLGPCAPLHGLTHGHPIARSSSFGSSSRQSSQLWEAQQNRAEILRLSMSTGGQTEPHRTTTQSSQGVSIGSVASNSQTSAGTASSPRDAPSYVNPISSFMPTRRMQACCAYHLPIYNHQYHSPTAGVPPPPGLAPPPAHHGIPHHHHHLHHHSLPFSHDPMLGVSSGSASGLLNEPGLSGPFSLVPRRAMFGISGLGRAMFGMSDRQQAHPSQHAHPPHGLHGLLGVAAQALRRLPPTPLVAAGVLPHLLDSCTVKYKLSEDDTRRE
ncbi:hypothetical protein BIW11_11062, partial [Tropilaelaps mercedesae]